MVPQTFKNQICNALTKKEEKIHRKNGNNYPQSNVETKSNHKKTRFTDKESSLLNDDKTEKKVKLSNEIIQQEPLGKYLQQRYGNNDNQR